MQVREESYMESMIARHLCLKNHPVAVTWADEMPENAIHFQEGKWGCVVALIKVASQGKIAAATDATTACRGGRVGLGFSGYEHGQIKYFLSTGSEAVPKSEHYKKTPELARTFIDNTVQPGLWNIDYSPLSGLTIFPDGSCFDITF